MMEEAQELQIEALEEPCGIVQFLPFLGGQYFFPLPFFLPIRPHLLSDHARPRTDGKPIDPIERARWRKRSRFALIGIREQQCL